jgi:hypothetical protein
MGGASGTEGVAPPTPAPEQFTGGWLPSTYRERRRLEDKIQEARDALENLAKADTAAQVTVARETLSKSREKRIKRALSRVEWQNDQILMERLRLLVEIDRLEAKIKRLDDDIAVILIAALAH